MLHKFDIMIVTNAPQESPFFGAWQPVPGSGHTTLVKDSGPLQSMSLEGPTTELTTVLQLLKRTVSSPPSELQGTGFRTRAPQSLLPE